MSFETGLAVGVLVGGYLMYRLVLAILKEIRRARRDIKQDRPLD